MKFVKEMQRGMRQAEKDAQKSADDIEKSFSSMSGNLGKEFRDASREIQRAAREAEREAIRAQQEMEREAIRAQREIERETKRAQDEIIKKQKEQEREFVKSQREMEKEAKRVIKEIIQAQETQEKEFIRSQQRMVKESERRQDELRRRVESVAKDVASNLSFKLLFDVREISNATAAVTKLGSALGVIGAGALAGQAGLGGFAALAAGIAQAAGAISLLPAAGAAASVAIGTLVIGLHGLEDALTADSPKEYAEALEKLAPAAQEFVKALRDMSDEANEFRKDVQNELFKGLADEVKQLADVLLPRVRTGFKNMATEINEGVREFAAFARESQSLDDLDTVLKNTVKSAGILGDAIKPGAQALRDLTTVGSQFLPLIAELVRNATSRFAEFIAKARESGQLEEFMRNSIEAVRDLMDIIGNLGSILNSVLGAAERVGGGLLQTLSNITQKVADFLKSAEGQTALIVFFENAKRAADAILPVLGKLAQIILTQVFPALVRIGEIAAPVLVKVLDALSAGLEKALPGIFKLVEGVGGLVTALVDAGVLDALGELVNVVGTALSEALDKIGPKLGEVLVTAIRTLADALPRIIPAIADVAVAFGDLLIAALPIIDLIAEIASSVHLPVIKRLFENLVPVIGDLVKGIRDALLPVLPQLVDSLIKLADALVPVAGDVGKAFVDILRIAAPLMPPLIDAITNLVLAITPLIKFLSFVTGLLAELFEFLSNKIPGGISKFIEALQLIPGVSFLGPLNSLNDVLGNVNGKLNDVSTTLNGTLRNAIDQTPPKLGELQGAFEVGLGNIFHVVDNFGKSTKDTYLLAMSTMALGVGGILGNITSNVEGEFSEQTSIIGGETSEASKIATANLLKTEEGARVAMARMNAAIRAGVDQVGPEVGRIAGVASSGIGNLGGTLYGSGQSLVSGFISGIRSMIGAAVSAAAAVANAVAGAFPRSPAKYGPFSGRGWTPYRGQALVEGFAEGITGSIQTAVQAAMQLAREVSSHFPTSVTDVPAGAFTPPTGRVTPPPASLTRSLVGLTTDPASVYAGTQLASLNKLAHTNVTPPEVTVEVYLGEQPLTQLVDNVVTHHNRRFKRAVVTGSRRTT